MDLVALLNQPIVKGAVSGFLAAAAVDFHAFKSWKTDDEFKNYAWGLAVKRWIGGAVTGAVGALGLGQILA